MHLIGQIPQSKQMVHVYPHIMAVDRLVVSPYATRREPPQ
jgi:hypothetical protein